MMILTTFVNDGLGQRDKGEKSYTRTIPPDSLEHELTIIDPGFDVWLATQPPIDFYSYEYYRQKNIMYVNEWNRRYNSGRNRGLYEYYIDYSPNINYPPDLNYRLYNYFRYFEKTNRVKLISSSR